MKIMIAQSVLIILMSVALLFLNNRMNYYHNQFNQSWEVMDILRTKGLICESKGGVLTLHPTGQGKTSGFDGGCLSIGIQISTSTPSGILQ